MRLRRVLLILAVLLVAFIAFAAWLPDDPDAAHAAGERAGRSLGHIVGVGLAYGLVGLVIVAAIAAPVLLGWLLVTRHRERRAVREWERRHPRKPLPER